MSDYLKHYAGTITVLGPVHIGAGQAFKKNEYIYETDDNSISIVDIGKVYQFFIDNNKAEDFEKYFSDFSPSSLPLKDWLASRGVNRNNYSKLIKYKMSAGDSIVSVEKGKKKYSDVLAFVKDPYGLPYIPGSSIKGFLRTALTVYEISKKTPSEQSQLLEPILKTFEEYDDLSDKEQQFFRKKKSKSFLKKEASDIETEIFNTLKKDKSKKSNAVNCNLSGLIIGDSRPIPLDALTVCKKYDVRTDKTENVLPIFKECLKPNTKVEFDLTIESVCPYSIGDIEQAIRTLNAFVAKRFMRHFDLKYSITDTVNIGWLGSCGFSSKNIVHSFYKDSDENIALDLIDGIFDVTLDKNYEVHKHGWDCTKYVVAPHMRKQTVVNGMRYDFGKVRLDFK